jgi:hypothetical protein
MSQQANNIYPCCKELSRVPDLFNVCSHRCMFVTIVCDKCESIIRKLIVMRSVRDVLTSSCNRCTHCGVLLNPAAIEVRARKA